LTHPATLLKIPIGEWGIRAGPPEESRLRLSKRTEYGVRAIVQLARHWPRNFIHSQHLAQEEGLPNKFLESILLALRRGGFLDSKIGREGGYRLARAPREIRVGDIIRRLEGRLTLKDPALGQDRSPGEVAVHLLNEKLTQATDDVLDQMTLEQLVEHVNKAGNFQQEMYYI
jgi:Rrf2 family transcriptional regulator, cysteine metabolism repressor